MSIDIAKFDSTLDLILKIIAGGGALLPIALAAFKEIKAETGWTDEEIMARAKDLSDENRERLLAIING